MRRTVITTALALFASMAVAACSDVGSPKPLSIDLSADRTTAAVGDSISFEAVVEGFEIIRITADMGDDSEEVVFELPALDDAFATWKHAYSEPGNYMVQAGVLDWSGGTRADTLFITVQ